VDNLVRDFEKDVNDKKIQKKYLDILEELNKKYCLVK
jgi:hemerythrin-like domain-containing protein